MDDKLIFEKSSCSRIAYDLPKYEHKYSLSNKHKRESELLLPEVSELDVVRHFTNLSKKNFGVDEGFYPLGSCTMKYNPKINEELAGLKEFNNIHPLQNEMSLQGCLEIYYNTSKLLEEITGMAKFSFAPCAGAHGELTGLMVMKKYFEERKEFNRKKVIVPVSAHGTNPASAAVCGFEIAVCNCVSDGCVDVEMLKGMLDENVAGIMLTNPSTLGIFEKDILLISKLVHKNGSLMYYDGANLNAVLGYVKTIDMGFDIMHINLHKTFSTPHGGGGPGSGPVGVRADLVKYLPNPIVEKKNDKYHFVYSKKSIGKVSTFYGNFNVVIKAYTYILSLGKEHISDVSKLAVLNANYIKESLKDDYILPIDRHCKHEVVFDGIKDHKVSTLDIAKRLLDYGYHPPTIYFPLLFHETLMIEPTENESKETLDGFINVMKKIAHEDIEILKTAPHTTIVRRLDDVKAARFPIIKYRDLL
ncbi:MAG: aminomethyl-transferring glycine dehydrogenase subunit GcvPB [Bacilli bacterium]|nr:aminomethyl-transferring glycine dehydrogenase subunit GcvPB [Bacilli bacterium]